MADPDQQPSPAANPTLTELIVTQARQRPDAPAVQQWSQTMTYRQLLGRAGRLAAQLRDRGVGPEHLVGVCLRRTPDAVVAVLGVLLSGAGYVPLDLSHPRQRCRDVAAAAGLALAVVDDAGRQVLDGLVEPVAVPPAADDPLPDSHGPAVGDNVAYVLYTSGSTGQPKGVLCSHTNVVAFVTGCAGWSPGVGPQMRSLAVNSFGFDAAVIDLFVPLCFGGSVQLATEDDRADPTRLQRFANHHRATWGLVTPAVLALLDPTGLPELAVIMSGGDVVPPELVEPWTASGRTFINAYGPTEATVGQITKQAAGRWDGPLPIGQAVAGHRAYLWDGHGQPVPDGHEGELYLAGPGIARGYLHQPALTAERFLPDPYAPQPGARMYRTGDMARRLPDGDLAFLGRRDGQLQIRGQRIELGETEAALRAHPAVIDAAATAVPTPDGPQLVAYVTPASAPGPDALRDWVGRRLPAAMVPRWVQHVAQLPLLASGKVDRARLGEHAADLVAGLGTPEQDVAEAADPLAALWQRILGAAPPGPQDDFFAVGGHSLAAMRLVAAIREQLRRDVSVEDVFAAGTFAGLSQRVAAAAELSGPELVGGHPPALAPSQRRMWFLDKLSPHLSAYNIVFAERLRGSLDRQALGAALTAVATRQDILRWRIEDAEGQPRAVMDPPSAVPLPVLPLAEAELPDALATTASGAFDLARGPLWRATLFQLAVDDHVLVVTFHHAIVDGWSQAQFYDDISQAYARAVAGHDAGLPELPLRYADYVAWLAQRHQRQGGSDLRWWRDHLAGVSGVLDLPRDEARPAVQSYAGSMVGVSFSPELDAAVRELATACSATVPQVVLAGLGQALQRLTGERDVVVGTITADRQLAAMDEVVGFFVDTVPMRLRVDDGASFTAAVQQCRGEYLATTAHLAAPLEEIVGELQLPRDPSRSPLVQVIFNAYNFRAAELDLPGVHASAVPVPPAGSPFDLTVYLLERDGTLALDLLYNRDLYRPERMRRLADDLVTLLSTLVRHCDKPTGELVVPMRTDTVATAEGDTSAAGAAPSGVGGIGALAAAGAEPANDTERMIAGVWREVLGLAHVRATDNFFDVGGHSLALVTIQDRLATLLGRPIPVVDLFRHPSVRALAAHLDGTSHHSGLSRAAHVAAARRSRTRRRRPT